MPLALIERLFGWLRRERPVYIGLLSNEEIDKDPRIRRRR
jgi:hypothetical protein